MTDSAKLGENRAPAHGVHSDFTCTGALHHLDQTMDLGDNSEIEIKCLLQENRILIVNVWRPLRTITRDPLAVCDWSSVNPKDDWIANRLVFPHGWQEFGRVAHSERHRWYYLHRQRPDEPLLFKQFDSRAGRAGSDDETTGGFTVAHTAFVDPEFADVEEPRKSIEIKMLAFIPE